jgi:hypothetical protein
VIGIDIGKNTFHLVNLDKRGAIALRQKLSRGQVAARLANIPPCLIGMGACVGAHHLSRQLLALGHVVKVVPAQFVKPFLKGQKNDFRDAEVWPRQCGVLPCALFPPRVSTSRHCIERMKAAACGEHDPSRVFPIYDF